MEESQNDEVDKLVMQVTLYREDSPHLFQLLASMRAKKRSGRVKDLAKLGLMVERSGQLSIAQPNFTSKVGPAALPDPAEGDSGGGVKLAASMLDWGDDGN